MIEIAVFASLVIAGYATRAFIEVVLDRTEVCEKLATTLSRVIYYILIPIAFATTFSRRGLLNLDAPVLAYYAILIATARLIAERLYKGQEKIVAFFLSAFPNSVFLGFPICYALFGNIDVAAVFGTLTLALNVAIPDVIIKGRAPLKAVATSTAFLGFATGVVLHYAMNPMAKLVHQNLWWSTLLLSYLATYTMGLRIPLSMRGLKSHRELLITVGVTRFLIAPLITIPISTIAGFSKEELLQLLVVSSTPPAVMNVLIAEKYRLNSQIAAVVTAVLTITFLAIVFPIFTFVVRTLL